MFNRLISLGLAVSCLVSATDLAERQTTAPANCATGIHMMVGGGCAIPCQQDGLDLLVTLVGNITAAIPGSDYWLVPYDGAAQQAQESTPLMEAAVNQYVASCPNTPIAFIGYSLGAIVMLNTLCGGISYTPNVVAAITYGEETFRYPNSFDAGTCTASAPAYPRNNSAQCAPFANVIQDYCDSDDPKCCSGGTAPLAHYAYPLHYDFIATSYVVAKYQAFIASIKAATTTSAIVVVPTSTVVVVPTSTPVVVVPTSTSAIPIIVPTSTSAIAIASTSTSAPAPIILPPSSSTTAPIILAPSSSVSPAKISTTTIATSSLKLSSALSSAVAATTTTTKAASASATSAPVLASSSAAAAAASSRAAAASSSSTAASLAAVASSLAAAASSASAAKATTAGYATGTGAASTSKSSATLVPYTGAAAGGLVVPGAVYLRGVAKVWRSVGAALAVV